MLAQLIILCVGREPIVDSQSCLRHRSKVNLQADPGLEENGNFWSARYFTGMPSSRGVPHTALVELRGLDHLLLRYGLLAEIKHRLSGAARVMKSTAEYHSHRQIKIFSQAIYPKGKIKRGQSCIR